MLAASGHRCIRDFGLHFYADITFIQDSSASIDPCHASLKGTASIKPPVKTDDNSSSTSSSSTSSRGSSGPVSSDRKL
jgi:hypothetical protein